MKGFPNQVADLTKIASGMKCLVDIDDAGGDAYDEGTLGRALVRAHVAGTGHRPAPDIEAYIRAQELKRPGDQSHRATARGLRELYRRMGLIEIVDRTVRITVDGRRSAEFAGQPLGDEQIAHWRRVIRNIEHDGEGAVSHPYQVLLGLVSARPGIPRAKCALALEARDDSPAELERIIQLSDLPEDQIIQSVGVSVNNWDNAKKVLPKFAEQLGDVVRSGTGTYTIARAPGTAAAAIDMPGGNRGQAVQARPPRRRQVTPDTIGAAGLGEGSDEVEVPLHDPVAAARARATLADRLRRHNLLVRTIAARCAAAQAELFEDPFDILAEFESETLLIEVKTLDGSPPDERDRVRDALSQLLYYAAFATAGLQDRTRVKLIACFEGPITTEHAGWLNDLRIGVMWPVDSGFHLDGLCQSWLGDRLA